MFSTQTDFQANSGLYDLCLCDFNDDATLRKHILSLLSGQVLASNPEAIARYSRHELTRQLCDVLSKIGPAAS